MALATQFDRDLRKLFTRRTSWLYAAIGKKRPGPAPAFAKKIVKPAIESLTTTARQILLKKRARKEFQASILAKRQWQTKKNKGHGRAAKKASFRRWYGRNIHGQNCIYVFWSGRRCEYVGRTVRGHGRPSSSFDKYWFSAVTRIDIYSVAGPSVVAKAECLAIDLFDPRRNIYSSSRPKFSKRCPICSAEKEIRRELKRVFPLRAGH